MEMCSAVGYGREVVRILSFLTQFLQDIDDVIFIVAIAWMVKNFKERIIAYIQNKYLGGVESTAGASRMMLSFGYLMNYAIYIASGFLCLDAFGFDVSPLLASVGASSVIIGIASRNVLENFAAAVTLYTAPPFAVGDAVKFINFGSLVAEGKVLAIEPLRTIIETKEGTTMYISNSLVIKWMVDNLSQKSGNVPTQDTSGTA